MNRHCSLPGNDTFYWWVHDDTSTHLFILYFTRSTGTRQWLGTTGLGTTGYCWCQSDQPTVRSVFNPSTSKLLATPLVPQYTHHSQLNSKYPNTKNKNKKVVVDRRLRYNLSPILKQFLSENCRGFWAFRQMMFDYKTKPAVLTLLQKQRVVCTFLFQFYNRFWMCYLGSAGALINIR